MSDAILFSGDTTINSLPQRVYSQFGEVRHAHQECNYVFQEQWQKHLQDKVNVKMREWSAPGQSSLSCIAETPIFFLPSQP